MYKELQRTCTAIVLLIKPFVLWRSRCLCRRGLLKLTNICYTATAYSYPLLNAKAKSGVALEDLRRIFRHKPVFPTARMLDLFNHPKIILIYDEDEISQVKYKPSILL